MDLFGPGYPIVMRALKGFPRDDFDRLTVNYGDNCIAVWANDSSAQSLSALNNAVMRMNSAFDRAGWERRGSMKRGQLEWMKYRPKS